MLPNYSACEEVRVPGCRCEVIQPHSRHVAIDPHRSKPGWPAFWVWYKIGVLRSVVPGDPSYESVYEEWA